MGLFSKKITIATHDGKFHADDLFACATLRLALGGKIVIVRTRDQKTIDTADYVVDVGGTYDPLHYRFDHHMPEGAGMHANGIPYASFGLVWKQFGAKIAGSPAVAVSIEKKLVSPIDADDNGVSLVASTNDVLPYGFQSYLYTYRPTWKEDPDMYDISFMELLPVAERIIMREVKIARDAIEAVGEVERAYAQSADKRIVVLDGPYPYQETLGAHPEPLYVVAPRLGKTDWKVETVHAKPYGFENRKSLPSSWAGLRDEELAKVTGVPDAVFCHRALFLAVAKTKEGALALAKVAVDTA